MSADTGTRAPLHAGPGAWLLLAPDLLPDAWRHRSVALAGVWLDPAEVAAVADGDPHPLVNGDRDLVPLVLQGLAHEDLARVLHVSVRTVQRRLARLRARLGARSHAELVTILAHRSATGRAGATTSNLSEDVATPVAKCPPPPGPPAARKAAR